jgi:hypothetical protein
MHNVSTVALPLMTPASFTDSDLVLIRWPMVSFTRISWFELCKRSFLTRIEEKIPTSVVQFAF